MEGVHPASAEQCGCSYKSVYDMLPLKPDVNPDIGLKIWRLHTSYRRCRGQTLLYTIFGNLFHTVCYYMFLMHFDTVLPLHSLRMIQR